MNEIPQGQMPEPSSFQLSGTAPAVTQNQPANQPSNPPPVLIPQITETPKSNWKVWLAASTGLIVLIAGTLFLLGKPKLYKGQTVGETFPSLFPTEGSTPLPEKITPIKQQVMTETQAVIAFANASRIAFEKITTLKNNNPDNQSLVENYKLAVTQNQIAKKAAVLAQAASDRSQTATNMQEAQQALDEVLTAKDQAEAASSKVEELWRDAQALVSTQRAVALPPPQVQAPAQAPAQQTQQAPRQQSQASEVRTSSDSSQNQELNNLRNLASNLERQLAEARANQNNAQITALTAQINALAERITRLGSTTQNIVITLPNIQAGQTPVSGTTTAQATTTRQAAVTAPTQCADPSFTYDPSKKVCVPPARISRRTKPEERVNQASTTGTPAIAAVESEARVEVQPALESPQQESASQGRDKTKSASQKIAQSKQKLHGAYIQGQTGPGVAFYSLLIGLANGVYYWMRRKRN